MAGKFFGITTIFKMQIQFSQFSLLFGFDSWFNSVVAQNSNTFFSLPPASYSKLSAVLIRDNLAVIPGDWDSGNISQIIQTHFIGLLTYNTL